MIVRPTISSRHSVRLALSALLAALALAISASAQETALDRYIAKPDPSYVCKLVNTISGQGCRAYVLELTSQTWRTADEVDKPV